MLLIENLKGLDLVKLSIWVLLYNNKENFALIQFDVKLRWCIFRCCFDSFDLRKWLFAWSVVLAVYSIVGTFRSWIVVSEIYNESGMYGIVCNNKIYLHDITRFWSFSFVISKMFEFGKRIIHTDILVWRRLDLHTWRVGNAQLAFTLCPLSMLSLFSWKSALLLEKQVLICLKKYSFSWNKNIHIAWIKCP